MEMVSGLVIPPAHHQQEPVLKRFVKDIRLERAKHPAGCLYNSFFKLIFNLMYGSLSASHRSSIFTHELAALIQVRVMLTPTPYLPP